MFVRGDSRDEIFQRADLRGYLEMVCESILNVGSLPFVSECAIYQSRLRLYLFVAFSAGRIPHNGGFPTHPSLSSSFPYACIYRHPHTTPGHLHQLSSAAGGQQQPHAVRRRADRTRLPHRDCAALRPAARAVCVCVRQIFSRFYVGDDIFLSFIFFLLSEV